MKILVTGGRDYDDALAVEWALDQLEEYLKERGQSIWCIIHGDATGADSLADEWAAANGYLQVRCPANWFVYKEAAGPVRNTQMLVLNPDLVVAFPGGKGTTDMIKKAADKHCKVWDPIDGGLSIWDFMKPYTIFDDMEKNND